MWWQLGALPFRLSVACHCFYMWLVQHAWWQGFVTIELACTFGCKSKLLKGVEAVSAALMSIRGYASGIVLASTMAGPCMVLTPRAVILH